MVFPILLAGILFFAVGTPVVTHLAADSTNAPDSSLYGLQKFSEGVRLAYDKSPDYVASLAEKRAVEIEYLQSEGKASTEQVNSLAQIVSSADTDRKQFAIEAKLSEHSAILPQISSGQTPQASVVAVAITKAKERDYADLYRKNAISISNVPTDVLVTDNRLSLIERLNKAIAASKLIANLMIEHYAMGHDSIYLRVTPEIVKPPVASTSRTPLQAMVNPTPIGQPIERPPSVSTIAVGDYTVWFENNKVTKIDKGRTSNTPIVAIVYGQRTLRELLLNLNEGTLLKLFAAGKIRAYMISATAGVYPEPTEGGGKPPLPYQQG